MKVITLLCDKCQDKTKKARSYRYADGKEMDASGNGYNENWVHLELCTKCLLQHGRDFPRHNLEENV